MDGTKTEESPRFYHCRNCTWKGASFRASCPLCGSFEMDFSVTSGKGRVVDLVPVLFPPKNLKNIGAYTSVLVRFEEGFKRFGIFAGAPEKLSIGDPVRIESFNGDTQELFLTNG